MQRLLERGVVLHPRGVQREPRGVDPEPLPRLHLALVAALGDLSVPDDRRRRMNRIGREGFGIGVGGRLRIEGCEVGGNPLARAGDESEARDDDRAPHGSTGSANRPMARARARIGASSPSGNGMVRKRSSASHNALPAWLIAAFVTA